MDKKMTKVDPVAKQKFYDELPEKLKTLKENFEKKVTKLSMRRIGKIEQCIDTLENSLKIPFEKRSLQRDTLIYMSLMDWV